MLLDLLDDFDNVRKFPLAVSVHRGENSSPQPTFNGILFGVPNLILNLVTDSYKRKKS